MVKKNFKVTVEFENPGRDVFIAITKDVAKWWGGKDFKGSSTNPGDEFVIHHPGAHYSKQRLVEVVQGKKVVWLVNESEMSWLEQDKYEWTNTKMIFEIAAEGDKTLLRFTHEGLVPGKESYDRCSGGWNMVIKERLLNFIRTGQVSC